MDEVASPLELFTLILARASQDPLRFMADSDGPQQPRASTLSSLEELMAASLDNTVRKPDFYNRSICVSYAVLSCHRSQVPLAQLLRLQDAVQQALSIRMLTALRGGLHDPPPSDRERLGTASSSHANLPLGPHHYALPPMSVAERQLALLMAARASHVSSQPEEEMSQVRKRCMALNVNTNVLHLLGTHNLIGLNQLAQVLMYFCHPHPDPSHSGIDCSPCCGSQRGCRCATDVA